jgi:cystathionine beta-lyase/cystathionine gamma-synthase
MTGDNDPENQSPCSNTRFGTRAIHAGQDPDPETGAVMTPIYASSTFAQDRPGEHRGYEYSRTANPTRTALEENLAHLEDGDYGRAFASGMAAINTVLNLLESGDHVVVGEDIYGGTYRLFTQVYEKYDLEFDFVDMTDVETVTGALRPETELVWLETPTNPLLKVIDIEAVATAASEYDALLTVDNTFATPYLQRPLNFGADVVVHSLTKYLGGHSDLVAGALVTDDPDLDEQLGFYQNSVGATPDPFACFLAFRGIKTLPVRMDRHCENARALASWLDDHPSVGRVYYPGLDSHPTHTVAATQMDDFGGMISFEVEASLEAVEDLVSSTEIFTLAESLGGVESLIEQPATMTHGSVPREERLATGVTDGLVRLSVGLEDVADLRTDLEEAFVTAGVSGETTGGG